MRARAQPSVAMNAAACATSQEGQTAGPARVRPSVAYNVRILSFARANANLAFDFAAALMTAMFAR